MHAIDRLPSTPAIAAHRPSVLDDDIPAPRRKRRFFSHAAVGAARRFSSIAVLGSLGYAAVAALRFGHEGATAALLLFGLTALPCAGSVVVTSAMLASRRRRLRHEARTLLQAAEERLPEGDGALESVRALAAGALRPLTAKEMQELEARVDYFGDVIRERRSPPRRLPSSTDEQELSPRRR